MELKHRVLLELSSVPDGFTMTELVDKTMLPKREIAKTLGELEIFGAIQGVWKTRESDKRWVRKYVITGEGTRDFIDHLKLHHCDDYPDLK